MTNRLSDHFSNPSNAELPTIPRIHVSQAVDRGFYRYKRGEVDLTGVTVTVGPPVDQIRLMTLRSGDRISRLLLSSVAAGTYSGTLGLYQAGTAHDGPIVDKNLFSSHTPSNGLSQDSVFNDGSVTNDLVGAPLFELVGQSSDPHQDWDIVLTISSAANTASRLLLEAYFTREGS